MATSEGGERPAADGPAPADADADVVITTVVSADEERDPLATPPPPSRTHDDQDLEWMVGADVAGAEPALPSDAPLPASDTDLGQAPPGGTADDGQPAPSAMLEERLAGLEGLPATVEALGKAVRHELERCAGVLFGHDRALGAIAGRLDALEAKAAEAGPVADRTTLQEETIARVLDQLERLDQRVNAAEARVEPLEPLPTLVQALRRAVRASDELIAGERAAREHAVDAVASQLATEAQARDDGIRRLVAQDLERVSAIATAQAKGLADLADRVAAVEGRLAPLVSVPDDVAALSRILRRELDALVSDNQARDQMLRRALQNEIDQLQATSEAREALARELATRLDALESRSAEATQAYDQAVATAGRRLDALEARIAAVDRLNGELDALRETAGKELEQLRAGGQTYDQVAGELTRRLAALDGRVARLDAVPGEIQSLRTALLQEAERTVASLRAVDERIGQLSWVPGEFQEARKRIIALTAGLQAGQEKIRQLEETVASTSERLDAVRARLSTVAPPGPAG